jgi:acetate kinase
MPKDLVPGRRPLRILVVNAGSTSVKISLLAGEEVLQSYSSIEEALATAEHVDAVAHRVVHGGRRTAATVLDEQILAELRSLVDLVPLHQPQALAAIDRFRGAFPDVPQIACFDTTFHTTIPAAAATYALPARLRKDVRVYGFHGLSHAWSARRVTEIAPAARRAVVAHLGGGQSLCAVLDGQSVGTTMGFSPLDGLVMATRGGSIDPGALLWLRHHTDEDLDHVLERESGLLALCGTGDMRAVLDRADAGDGAAGFALDVYLHRLIVLLGGCIATLGGLDALVFTGGIGEHAPRVRELVAERLAWAGVVIDQDLTGEEITAASASVRTFVIAAREDIQAADEAAQVLLG